MANNTVEATLRSKFEDGVTRAFQATEQTLSQAMGNIRNAGAAAAAGFNDAFSSMVGGLTNFREHLNQSAEESNSAFGKIGLAAAAMTIAAVAAFLKAGKAAADFIFDLAKESSASLETRMAFESLTAAMGEQASVLLGKLKQATEGQISGTMLMQNANRVMQSGVQISTAQYAQLTDNIFRLAKSSGVDAPQAINTLTDAIIRGNARGLQAIGLHLAVKDAISAMAEASGQGAGKLADAGRMQAFYNELLQQSGAAVAQLGPKFLTVEDLIRQSKTTWDGFVNSLGVAIGRSGVLQELMQRLSEAMLGPQDASKLNAVTLAVNAFIISTLRGFAGVMDVLGYLSIAWNVVWGTVKGVVNGVGTVTSAACALIESTLYYLFVALGKLPGLAGAPFRAATDSIHTWAAQSTYMMQLFAKDTYHAFDGVTDGQQKLGKLAEQTRGLAEEMEKYRGVVLQGAAGTKTHGDAAGDAAEQQKKLNEQLAKYAEIRAGLLSQAGLGGQAALQQMFSEWAKIDQDLTMKGAEWDAKRNELKSLAVQAYVVKMQEILKKGQEQQQKLTDEGDKIGAESEKNREQQMLNDRQAFFQVLFGQQASADEQMDALLTAAAKKREEDRKKEAESALSAANAIVQAIDLAAKGKISANTGIETLNQLPQTMAALQKQLDILRSKPILTEEQVNEVVKLQAALDKLNQIKWTPFQKALDGMKQNLKQFTEQGVQAFADFFSALVQGQEGAAQKLLGAFIGMIGQMLVHTGVVLVQTGIAEIAMAQTLVGRLMGASVAGGLKAIAVGAAIAALGGIMEGAAANLSQSGNSAASSTAATTDSSSSSSSTNQVQVINVGTPYGPQNPQQASGQGQGEQHVVEIRPPKGWVVNEVVGAVRGNNRRVRIAIQNA